MYVEGDPVNGAVGELIFHNRYSYANNNPVNLTDPSGMCAQPTEWWNPVDANCYYSAVGLAQRFSQGNPQVYNEWFNVLIQRPWHELKVIEAAGTVSDATILPSLALREDPGLVLEALKQFTQLIQCGFSGTTSFAYLGLGTRSLPGLAGEVVKRGLGAKILIPGVAIGAGIVGGIIILLGVNAIDNSTTDDDDDECSKEKMVERIGGRSIGQIVGNIGNVRLGESEIYKFGIPGKDGVVEKAIEICQTGDTSDSFFYRVAPGLNVPE